MSIITFRFVEYELISKEKSLPRSEEEKYTCLRPYTSYILKRSHLSYYTQALPHFPSIVTLIHISLLGGVIITKLNFIFTLDTSFRRKNF